MGYTNSSLVTYTRISPNRNSPRNQPITKITIHHMAGVNSVEGFGNIVAQPAREMSANYAIGNDGRIGLYCPESDRSWCSSSAWNDNRAITIEVSNSAYGDASGWPISTAAYNSLIKLCVDICKRNGIKKLEYTGTRDGSLTIHSMFAATACCGPYLKARLNDICDKVNAQLGGGSSSSGDEKKDDGKTYTVKLKTTDPVYDTPGGKQIDTVGPGNVFTIVEDKTIGYIKYGKLKSGKGWVIVEDKTPTSKPATIQKGDLVTLAADARYYTGAAIPKWVLQDKWYVDSLSGDRAVLGKNQSGSRNIQSPVNTKFLTKVSGGGAKNDSNEIVKGSIVKVLNPIIYGTTRRFTVYASKYYVLEVSGNRVVISADNKNVTAAIDKKNLQKIG